MRRGARRRGRWRGGPRQPSAADLGDPPGGRGTSIVAPPRPPGVRAGVDHELRVRRRRDRRRPLSGAGRRDRPLQGGRRLIPRPAPGLHSATMNVMPRRPRRALVLAALVSALAALSACSGTNAVSQSVAGSNGYQAGDNGLSWLAPRDRPNVGAVSGELLDGTHFD